jgi:type VI protein secretion system component Hcp
MLNDFGVDILRTRQGGPRHTPWHPSDAKVRSGGDKLKYMEYKLSNCIISKIATSGGRGDFPSEVLKISFSKIVWTYTQQNRQGGGTTKQVATGWNLEKNCNV